MQCIELKKNLYYVGVIDHGLKVFDVSVKTTSGTSYNSYLLKTDEGVVIFEGSKAPFSEEYIAHIESLTSPNAIKYLVVSHTEPDHSGAIERFLQLNPNIIVVASPGALINLEKIIRHPFNKLEVKPGSALQVGEYTFRFISGLLLHWPDVMFTYIQELKVLVSCDAFGCHYASDDILLSKTADKKGYAQAYDYYFESIMKPFAAYVKAAVARVKILDIDMICCGHGPVVDIAPQNAISRYEDLAEKALPIYDPKHVTIVFASAYGYTRAIAESLQDRFIKDGKTVSFYEISALNYENLREAIIDSIRVSSLVLVGSPTIVGDAVPMFYDLLSRIPWAVGQGKKASAFGNYGWSGEAVNNLSERLKQLRFIVISGYKVNFKADDDSERRLGEYYESLTR
jgi:NADH oxidase (H2O-forming)